MDGQTENWMKKGMNDWDEDDLKNRGLRWRRLQ
jgi:hypothetical protein